MSTLRERIERALKLRCQHHGCQAELARACGVKEASVADWLSGKTLTLKAEPAVRAARWLGVSAAWLILGEGAMKPEVDPWDMHVAHALRQLPPELRQPWEAAILAAAGESAKPAPPAPDPKVIRVFPATPRKKA